MFCKEVAELLLRFKDGDLSEAETHHLREHLHMCPPCTDLFNSYEEAVEVLRRLKPVKMPEGLCERLKQKLKEEGGCGD